MKRAIAAAAIAVALAAAPAAAKDEASKGTWSFTLENDLIAGTDRDYTNGALISYVGPEGRLPLVGRFARDHLGWLTSAKKWHMTYGFGQNMYSPKDITTDRPDPTDRPYAGFLYGSIGVVADTRDETGKPAQLDVLALDVGMVGQESLAEQAQKAVHNLIDSEDPKGWGSQLGSELAFRLLYERTWRASNKWSLPLIDIEGDMTPHAGLALGTAETYGSIGISFRLGDDLDDDYGPPRIRPALASPGFFRNVDGFSWYVFAGVEGRAVARDLFVEGNTFKDSAGVDLVPLHLDVQAGLAIQVDDIVFAFTHVLRSPQHEAQRRWNRFGSINVRALF